MIRYRGKYVRGNSLRGAKKQERVNLPLHLPQPSHFIFHALLDLGGIKSPVMAKQCNYIVTGFKSFQCLSSGFGLVWFGFHHCNICMEFVYYPNG